MSDTKHLTKRGDLYMFNWRVPKDCLGAFNGKRFVTKSLHTQSLREAKLRRSFVLAECLKVVQEVRAEGTDTKSLFKANIVHMRNASNDSLEGAWLSVIDKEPETDKDFAFKEALKVTHLGYDSALAKCTLKDSLKAYKEDKAGSVSSKTISHATRAVTVFLEFMQSADVIAEEITRKNVKDFIKATSLTYSGKTVSNRVKLLSSVFKVAIDDGLINEEKRNPFEGHKVSQKDTHSFERFSESQLKAIFKESEKYKEKPKDFHRYMIPRLAYATGCRIEELCSLQRDQVKEENGILYLAIAQGVNVYEGKTLNAGRRIPIHSALTEELKAWRSSADNELLFPELKSNRADGKHGDKFSKQFATFKRTLGITKRSQGFHSFRVHMATNLERAEVPENRAVWIMGHTRTLSLSYGLYSDGPSLEQLRDDVERSVLWPHLF